LVAMAMKNRPCAYCGTTDTQFERERGHVVPACVYPPSLDPRVQRITVPECSRCKEIWQDDETQFRNIMMLAGDPNAYVQELWDGPVTRSFQKPSGPRWVADLIKQLVPVETEGGPRHMVYPGRDERVMLVVRKIIRGLCHEEKVATAVDDRRVWADVMAYSIPEEFRRAMTWRQLDDKFFRYGFTVSNDPESDIHSAWSLTFFERREFIAVVSLSEAGWNPGRDQTEPSAE
jgi:hypothetical protein